MTVASSDIILTSETRNEKEEARVPRGSYLPFSLYFSMSMLAYYKSIVLSIVW